MADQASLYTTKLASPYVFTLDVLKVYGASEPDKLEKFGVTHEMLDGSLSEQIAGGRRDITIEFQVMSLLNRRKVVKWFLDPDRKLQSLAGTPGNFNAVKATGTGLTAALHTYTVCAVDVIGHSIAATEDSDTTSGSDLRMALSWNAVTDARYYQIYRKIAAGNWFLLDYTTSLTYTDAGTVGLRDMGAGLPPIATSSISVISSNELEFPWAFETELARMLTLELRDASIFTAANGFESVE